MYHVLALLLFRVFFFKKNKLFKVFKVVSNANFWPCYHYHKVIPTIYSILYTTPNKREIALLYSTGTVCFLFTKERREGRMYHQKRGRERTFRAFFSILCGIQQSVPKPSSAKYYSRTNHLLSTPSTSSHTRSIQRGRREEKVNLFFFRIFEKLLSMGRGEFLMWNFKNIILKENI